MDETEFLNTYDPGAFDRPSVAVDLVLMTVKARQLTVLLQRRAGYPYRGLWSLPGSFVGTDEHLDAAAARVMTGKAGLPPRWLEQLYTFGAPGRDPRMRVISIAYFALLSVEELSPALQRPDLMLAPVGLDGGTGLTLAFDHADIVDHAVHRLRGKLDYSPVAFALLPKLFTLRDLQDIHEAILGVTFAKPAFRRRMIDQGWIEGTGERERGTAFRPAELYRLRTGQND